MSEQAEKTPVATARLVFNSPVTATHNDDDDDAVPLFLRKEYAKSIKEPKSPEPVSAPASVEQPTIENSEPEPEPVASVSNLDKLSVEELRKQQEEIDRKIKEKQDAERQAVIEQIVHVVNMYQIPIEELLEALGGLKKVKRKGVRAIPKYQDPTTGVTWTGRGKEPLWIRGKDREAFLIKPNS